MATVTADRVKLILLAERDFISQAELARRCGVNRSTIQRMLDKFPARGIALELDERKWVRIDRRQYPFDLRLDLDEALAIYVAGRLLARHSDQPNPHVIDALTKLGAALTGQAKTIGDHILETSKRLNQKSTRATREYVQALEVLTEAWAHATSVYVFSRKEPRRGRKFDPYFIEPSMYTNYVIGFDHLRKDIRTFKVQWLKRVSPTAETFTRKPEFDAYDYLGHAWGINWGKGKLEKVRLCFTGNAAERVQDNVWHESQAASVIGDGWVELTFSVGDTTEMIPWIRQWGHECEVLEPEHLRTTITEHARKMADQYATSK